MDKEISRKTMRVPANWEHPRNKEGDYIPLLEARLRIDKQRHYKKGLDSVLYFGKDMTFEQYQNSYYNSYKQWYEAGSGLDGHMPNWSDGERTHLQMYEFIGDKCIPISPVMKTKGDLAKWLVNNNINVSDTDSKEETPEQKQVVIKRSLDREKGGLSFIQQMQQLKARLIGS